MRKQQQHRVVTQTIAAMLTIMLAAGAGHAQTTLGAGDIAFTGYNSDNPDDFSFVLLKDVLAGTTISFTDKGWQAAGGFRSSATENSTLTVTFSADRIAGEQFRIPASIGIFIDFNGLSAGPSTGVPLLLSATGDQIFAYQGSEPTDNSLPEQAKFIAAIQMNGPWDADATNDNTSALPPGLTDGVHAFAISPQVDNARFNCSVTGPDIASLRTALLNPANWDTNDNIRFALPAPCDLTCGLGTDNRPPLVICPFIMEEFLDNACDYTIDDYRPSVFAMDNCDPNFSLAQSPAPGTVVSGTTLITITATDVYNNTSTCSFDLFLTDDIPPQILSCPGDQPGQAGPSCLFELPDYTGMIAFMDNCDPNPEVDQNPAPGTLISAHTTIVLTVRDASGNTETCSFEVILEDVTEPEVFCSVDRFGFYDSNCSYTLPDFRSVILARDECDPNPVITQFPAPGTVVYQDTPVSFKIADASGNETSCAFTLFLSDITAPSLSCPPPIEVPIGSNCQALMPDMRPAVALNDACDPNPALVQIPGPGQALTENTFALFYTQDAGNNFNFCFTPVVLKDMTPPTLNCKTAFVTLQSNGSYTLQASDVIASMSDNCGPVTVVGISPATVSCQQAGQTVPVTVIVRDAAGNQTSCATTVTVLATSNITAPWTSTMVGNNFGAAVFNNCGSNFILYSSGFTDHPRFTDATHFVHQTLCGNGEIIARILSIDVPAATAGIMMRETTDPASKMWALGTRLSAFIFRSYRSSSPGLSTLSPFQTLHTSWLRIVRSGNFFYSYVSANGTVWNQTGVQNIQMNPCIEVGLTLESVSPVTIATAVFTDVSVIHNPPPLIDVPDTEPPLITAGAGKIEMEAFPNPASGETRIVVRGDYSSGELDLALLNSYGQAVWRSRWDPDAGSAMKIPLLHVPPGVYALQARSGENVLQTTRLVVQQH